MIVQNVINKLLAKKTKILVQNCISIDITESAWFRKTRPMFQAKTVNIHIEEGKYTPCNFSIQTL